MTVWYIFLIFLTHVSLTTVTMLGPRRRGPGRGWCPTASPSSAPPPPRPSTAASRGRGIEVSSTDIDLHQYSCAPPGGAEHYVGSSVAWVCGPGRVLVGSHISTYLHYIYISMSIYSLGGGARHHLHPSRHLVSRLAHVSVVTIQRVTCHVSCVQACARVATPGPPCTASSPPSSSSTGGGRA